MLQLQSLYVFSLTCSIIVVDHNIFCWGVKQLKAEYCVCVWKKPLCTKIHWCWRLCGWSHRNGRGAWLLSAGGGPGPRSLHLCFRCFCDWNSGRYRKRFGHVCLLLVSLLPHGNDGNEYAYLLELHLFKPENKFGIFKYLIHFFVFYKICVLFSFYTATECF